MTAMPVPERFIGLISGTSADAIDAVLVDFSEGRPRVLATHSHPLSPAVRATIHSLAQPGSNEIDRMGELDQLLGEAFAAAALEVISNSGLSPADITAIGSHGQTLRHRPPGDPASERAFSLQVADPNQIVYRTGITTIADFRRRDMAAGGEGAPLVPALHQALFHHPDEDRAIVNVGGIANITWLPAHGDVIGFDTGPGNNLQDAWIHRVQGKTFDNQGLWGASGQVQEALLASLLAHPYFAQPFPKSTGPEAFHIGWLDDTLSAGSRLYKPEDVQATLRMLTAHTLSDCLQKLPRTKQTLQVYLCGGGAHNNALRTTLAGLLPHATVLDTGALGLDPDWVEAVAFAWLARQTLKGLPGNLPAVTGARAAQVLGAIYPA